MGKGINSLAGAETAFSHDGSALLYIHSGPNSPNDIWAYECHAEIASDRALAGRWNAQRGHG